MQLLRTSGKGYSEYLILKIIAKFLTIAREVSYKELLWTELCPPKTHMSKSLSPGTQNGIALGKISKTAIK